MGWLERKSKLKTAGRRPPKGDGSSDYAFWVRSRSSELHPKPSAAQVADFNQWMADRVAINEGRMIDYNAPIRIFYANLLRFGFTLSVEDGALKVRGPMKNLSPAYRDEIMRRKDHLIEMLSPVPPAELAPYAYRVIMRGECNEAQEIAARLGCHIEAHAVDGGWLILFAEEGD